MAYTPGTLLGQITKTSGFEGAVIVRLEKNFIENIPHIESVFLEIEGRPVPFLILSSEYNGSDILKLAFDGYPTQEKAAEFKGCRVFLTTWHAASADSDFSLFAGFTVMTSDLKTLGKIKEVITNPGQLLLDIQSPDGKEILVPFHEDLIASVNRRKKTMIMDLPEGLADINL